MKVPLTFKTTPHHQSNKFSEKLDNSSIKIVSHRKTHR